MSIEVMSLVWSRKIGSTSRKAVLQVMADAANADGQGVWLSKPSIAARSEVSEKTVKRAIADMLDSGLISVTGKRKISNGFTTVYALNLDTIKALPRSQIDGGQIDRGDTVSPDTGTECPPTPGHSDPQTTLKPSGNHPNTSTRANRLKPDLPSEGFISDVMDRWNAMARAHGFPLLQRMTQDRIRLLRTRLAECDGNEALVHAVIDRVPKMTSWRGGGNRDHITFDWVHGPPRDAKPDRFLSALEFNPATKDANDRDHHNSRKSDQRHATDVHRQARRELLDEMGGHGRREAAGDDAGASQNVHRVESGVSGSEGYASRSASQGR